MLTVAVPPPQEPTPPPPTHTSNSNHPTTHTRTPAQISNCHCGARMLPPQQRCQKKWKKRKPGQAGAEKKRQEIPKKTQLWIVGIFVVCFECQRGWRWRGPRRRLWENGGLERQKYLSVKIVDKANDKRERRQNKRAIFPDVLQFDILRDFGAGPKDPLVFFSSPSLHDYVTCHLPKITNCQTAGCAYVIEFEGDQLNH